MERVRMPQLGETVTEGTVTRWLKQPGDPVRADEALFQVSTDKVDTDVPSAIDGVLRQILVPEGETVPVGTLLAVITATADEPLDEQRIDAVPPVPARAGTAASTGARPGADIPTPAATEPGRARRGEGRPYLSPVVQRLLEEHGLSPDAVVGSGRDGRITRADVLAAAANRTAPGRPSPPPQPAVDVAAPVEPGPLDRVVEFSRARQLTAEHMARSVATAAHALVVVEVDYHAVEAVRGRLGSSYLPFVARAMVDAIAEHPFVNASVAGDRLVVWHDVNLGIAVDVDREALVVPVVHQAQERRLRALADAVADLSRRARARHLHPDDVRGGTITITNVGAYGTVLAAPIINQPQVAILSTDGVRMRPVAIEAPGGGWTVAVRPVGNLSLSFDHRAIDGAYATSFLARVRAILETRDWAQEV